MDKSLHHQLPLPRLGHPRVPLPKRNAVLSRGYHPLETLLGFSSRSCWVCDRPAPVVERVLRKISEPYLVVLNALPKIALGPLIIIWCGTGSEPIVFMTILIGLIVAILNMLNGFMATDENKILLLRSMGANKRQLLTKLVIPSSPARLHLHAENQRRHGVDRARSWANIWSPRRASATSSSTAARCSSWTS